MLRVNSGEPLRCPSDAIRNLAVANLNTAKLAVGALNNVNGVEPGAMAFGTLVNDGMHIACW